MAIDFLEQQAKYLIYLFFYKKNTNIKNLEKYKNQKIIDYFFNEKKHNKYFLLLKKRFYIQSLILHIMRNYHLLIH